MMIKRGLVTSLALAALVGCSSSSSSTPAHDAGPEEDAKSTMRDGGSDSRSATDSGTDGGATTFDQVDVRYGFALANGEFYWLACGSGSCDSSPGTLKKMSSSGGAITTVASSAYVTQFLLATSTDVYWNAGANFTEIEAVAVGGGTPKALTSLSGGTNTGWFAIDKTSLYFVDNSSDLYAEPLAGGKATSLGASLSIDNLQMLVSDGTYLYALDNNGEQDDLVKVDIATHKMTTLAANVVVNTQNPAGTQLAVDKTNVYWNDYNGDLMKLALAGGGKPVKLASSAVAFTVDGDYAYFVGQTVSKVPVAGGKATTLYSSTYYNTDGFSPCVTTVATDATYVYWDCGGGEGKGYPGNILRIAK